MSSEHSPCLPALPAACSARGGGSPAGPRSPPSPQQHSTAQLGPAQPRERDSPPRARGASSCWRQGLNSRGQAKPAGRGKSPPHPYRLGQPGALLGAGRTQTYCTTASVPPGKAPRLPHHGHPPRSPAPRQQPATPARFPRRVTAAIPPPARRARPGLASMRGQVSLKPPAPAPHGAAASHGRGAAPRTHHSRGGGMAPPEFPRRPTEPERARPRPGPRSLRAAPAPPPDRPGSARLGAHFLSHGVRPTSGNRIP